MMGDGRGLWRTAGVVSDNRGRRETVGTVENIRCRGNDRRGGFCAAEWNGLSGDTKLVLSGDEDYY